MRLLLNGNTGRRRRISNLWAYVALAQILPISFTQNLFTLATLLSNKPDEKTSTRITPTSAMLATVIAYLTCLFFIPSVKPSNFISVLFLTRALLLAPYVLPLIKPLSVPTDKAHARYAQVYKLLLLGGALLVVKQSFATLQDRSANITAPANDNHAVKAMSYDYVISMVSSLVWLGLQVLGMFGMATSKSGMIG